MIKKYTDFRSKINEEVGLRNMRQIAETYDECMIYFHMDLDGVASALSMKGFLERYKIKTIDAQIIQYGGIQYSIKNTPMNVMPVLVDFANSATRYIIATDHHDRQTGVDVTKSNYFKHARSNAETISGEIAPSDVFGSTDIDLIKTVDSADFLSHGLTPDDVQNSIFKYDRLKSPTQNRFLMGLVVNRLLLAFKNKRITVTSLDGKNHHVNKNLLECLVLDSSPSLYSIFNNLRHYINTAVSLEWDASKRSHQTPKKLSTPEQLAETLFGYIESRKKTEDISFDEKYKILREYGIGSVFKTGSYDRYVIFKNYPDADFVCKIFPMGLIQVSCNPFKEKKLKGINLGEISKEVLNTYKYQLSNINIPLSDVKRVNEEEIKKMQNKYGSDYEAIGFTFEDLEAKYKDSLVFLPNRKSGDIRTREKLNLADSNNPLVKILKSAMSKKYSEWTNFEKDEIGWIRISAWDIILGGSGGHASITNIQGFSFLSTRRDLLKRLFNTDSYLDVMNSFADKFINLLKEKIDENEKGKDITYDTGGVELKGEIMNENFEYFINQNNIEKKVNRDEFLKFGNEFIIKNKFEINIEDKKVIGKIKDDKKIS